MNNDGNSVFSTETQDNYSSECLKLFLTPTKGYAFWIYHDVCKFGALKVVSGLILAVFQSKRLRRTNAHLNSCVQFP